MNDIKQLHPELQEKIKLLQAKFPKIGFSECLRSVKEQDNLYAKGRTAPGKIVTNARGSTYSSQHQWGIAADYFYNQKGNIYPEPFMTQVGQYAQSIGLGWGGAWKSLVDKPHIYLPQWGDTTKKLKAQYGTPEKFMATWKAGSETTATASDTGLYKSIFDENFYKKVYPDVAAWSGELYSHFVQHGIKEGRLPSVCFDPAYYKNKHPDLSRTFGNDIERYYQHYMEFGLKEGRQGSIVFSAAYYKEKYADIRKAFGDRAISYPMHFIWHGMAEGRRASSDFDIRIYVSDNKDLAKSFGTDWRAGFVHYFRHGRNEKRRLV